MKITGEIDAYWTNAYGDLNDLLAAVRDKKAMNLLAYSELDMSEHWTKVGRATISVTFLSHAEIMRGRVTALRGLIKEARAECEAKITGFEHEINQLLAIEHTPAPEQPPEPFRAPPPPSPPEAPF